MDPRNFLVNPQMMNFGNGGQPIGRVAAAPPSTPFSMGKYVPKAGLGQGIAAFGNAFFKAKDKSDEKEEKKAIRAEAKAERKEEREYRRSRDEKADDRADRTFELRKKKFKQDSPEYKRTVREEALQNGKLGKDWTPQMKALYAAEGWDAVKPFLKGANGGEGGKGLRDLFRTNPETGKPEQGLLQVFNDGRVKTTWLGDTGVNLPTVTDSAGRILDRAQAVRQGPTSDQKGYAEEAALTKGKQEGTAAETEEHFKNRESYKARYEKAVTDWDSVERNVAEARKLLKGAGKMQVFAGIPGTDANSLKRVIATINGAKVVAELQKLGAAGVTLGQITEKEVEMLSVIKLGISAEEKKKRLSKILSEHQTLTARALEEAKYKYRRHKWILGGRKPKSEPLQPKWMKDLEKKATEKSSERLYGEDKTGDFGLEIPDTLKQVYGRK